MTTEPWNRRDNGGIGGSVGLIGRFKADIDRTSRDYVKETPMSVRIPHGPYHGPKHSDKLITYGLRCNQSRNKQLFM